MILIFFHILYVRNSKSHGSIQSGAFVIQSSASWHYYIQTAMTGAEHKSHFELWKDTPYLTCVTKKNTPYLNLKGKLWSVCCENLGKNWLCYMATCLLWKIGRNTYSPGPPKYHLLSGLCPRGLLDIYNLSDQTLHPWSAKLSHKTLSTIVNNVSGPMDIYLKSLPHWSVGEKAVILKV